jgi:IS30 family transposase
MLIAFSPARDAIMKTYKHLTYEQRYQIYALKITYLSQNKIAKQLNVSQSTISREFQRRLSHQTGSGLIRGTEIINLQSY